MKKRGGGKVKKHGAVTKSGTAKEIDGTVKNRQVGWDSKVRR